MNKPLRSLDILKGIGIVMIIIVHNRHFIMKDMTGFRQIINYGQMGCQLFFFVSGMALCYSWYHLIQKEQRKSFPVLYGKFILRRYLRLAPGFLIILAANYLLNILLMDIFHYSPGFIINRSPKAILANVLFVHGIYPDAINSVFPGGWYIGTTFILYLLFPLLVTLFQKLHTVNRFLIFPLPLLFLCLNHILLKHWSIASKGSLYPYNNSFLYYFFTNQLPCFLLGILLYFQENNIDSNNPHQKKYFSQKCPLLLSIALFLGTSVLAIRWYLLPEENYRYTYLPSLVGLSFYWLAVSMIHWEHRKTSLLPCQKNTISHKNRGILQFLTDFLAQCGKNSYGMYLVHAFICWYGVKGVTDAMKYCGYDYPDLTLYCILLLPSIFIVYVAGLYMGQLIGFIDKKLRKPSQ